MSTKVYVNGGMYTILRDGQSLDKVIRDLKSTGFEVEKILVDGEEVALPTSPEEESCEKSA